MEENKVIDLDSLLAGTNLDDVSAESAGFGDLPSGNYLCEVVSAVRTESKSSGLPMVSFRFKIIQNGIVEKTDEEGNVYLVRAKGTANRNVFKHYVLKDQASIKSLTSDLLKYEGDEPGTPILDEILTSTDAEGNKKIAIPNTEVLDGCLEVLTGLTIYLKADTRPDKNDPSKNNTWVNLLSWTRVSQLGLLEVPLED